MALGFPTPCPKCHARVNCEAGAGGGAAGNELNCCKCVPQRLQVSVWSGEVDDPYGPLVCRVAELDCAANEWTTTITVDGETYDLELYFGRDDDGVCWFYLESALLGWTSISGDTRPKVQLPGDYQAYRADRLAACADPAFTFAGVSIPGYGDVTITTGIADYQEIAASHRQRCDEIDPYDCPDPDLLSCRDCNCWCRCVCITYNDGVDAGTTRVCWDEYTESWAFAIGADDLSISLHCNRATGQTQLALTHPWDGSPLYQDANCPEVSASWSFEKDDTTPVSVSILCDSCGECTGGNPGHCGCPEPLPAVIYATFSPGTSPGPPEPYPKSCTGATGTIPMTWDDNASAWLGTGRPFAGCSTLVYLRIICAGSEEMTLELGSSWAALSDMGTVAITCDPLEGEWIGITPLLATDACCGTSGDPGTADYEIMNVTVTA